MAMVGWTDTPAARAAAAGPSSVETYTKGGGVGRGARLVEIYTRGGVGARVNGVSG